MRPADARAAAATAMACSWQKNPRGNDVVEEVDSFKIVTDKTNADILRGSKIDFIDTMQKQGFKIENPNVQGQGCGCGSGSSH